MHCCNHHTRNLLAVAAILTAGACDRSADNRPPSADSPAPSATGEMANMAGSMGTARMDSMQAHMQMMDTMSAGRMKEMLPAHRQQMANMLSQMNQEMRSMNMATDASWNATADSLRQDLTRMPDLTAEELKALMPAHRARMMRLMQMHRDMMRKMSS